MRWSLRGVVLVSVLALGAACSDGSDDGSELGTTSSIAPPVAPELPSESPAGTGVVMIGGTSSSFAVTTCELDAAPSGTGAEQLIEVEGAGTRANGVPFSVEVVRSSTDDASETFTDLITYMDTARILQVQRSETAGEVTDLRDPGVSGTLLRVRPGGLSATGIAGPPGTTAPAGPGLVGLALDVTC